MKDELLIGNYKGDGNPGNGISFAVIGDHENRPTDMTNIIVYEDIDRNRDDNNRLNRR